VYLKVGDVLQLNRFPYTYDLIEPAKFQTDKYAFVELVNIPIPQESVEINVYIHAAEKGLQREADYANSAFWFGIDRGVIDCCRCKTARTSIKIDIEDFMKERGLVSLDGHTIVIEAVGLLTKTSVGSVIYNTDTMIQDGACRMQISL
jgi:hypothetical protein